MKKNNQGSLNKVLRWAAVGVLASALALPAMAAGTNSPATPGIQPAAVHGLVSLPPAADYQNTNQIPIGLQNNKVVVYEFFSFTCPHCRDMFQSIHQWAATDPHVELVYVPVNWGPQFEPFMRLYYALEALNRLDLMGPAFAAVQDQHDFDTPSLINWLVSEGIDRNVAENTFNSFSMGVRLRQATELGNTYNVQGTPTLIVNGAYLVSPGLFTSLGEQAAYQHTLDTAKALVNYVWQTEGKK